MGASFGSGSGSDESSDADHSVTACNAKGDSLDAENELCSCGKPKTPHVHRWVVVCPTCGFMVICDGENQYYVPDHSWVSHAGRTPCRGNARRVDAQLVLWNVC